MSLSDPNDCLRAVRKGTQAAADALAEKLHWLKDDERALELARVAIDAWLLGSNPVGKPETIYDEFYRLREFARWAVSLPTNTSYEDIMDRAEAALDSVGSSS